MKYKSRTHGRKQYRNVILENNMTLSYAIGTLKSCFNNFIVYLRGRLISNTAPPSFAACIVPL